MTFLTGWKILVTYTKKISQDSAGTIRYLTREKSTNQPTNKTLNGTLVKLPLFERLKSEIDVNFPIPEDELLQAGVNSAKSL